MAVDKDAFKTIKDVLQIKNVTLVAVSKTKPDADIMELYNLGQKDFGENYVQELTDKYEQLPKDIQWHFIGHLQSNKVKYIAPFIYLIQSVDTGKLLSEINKQAKKSNRIINCLLQVHIAQEETKFGFNESELHELLITNVADYKNIQIIGLMGMASFTHDEEKVKQEFSVLKSFYDKYKQSSVVNSQWSILSMGMSGDYEMAIQQGSNMVRIGSLLFGKR